MERPSSTANERAWSAYIAFLWGGRAEVRTFDGSYIDVVDRSGVAWEVEWAKKWKEAPGQAALYQTTYSGGGVVLLTRRKPTETVYYLRCAVACRAAGLQLRTWDTL